MPQLLIKRKIFPLNVQMILIWNFEAAESKIVKHSASHFNLPVHVKQDPGHEGIRGSDGSTRGETDT